jgi:superfamily II DNA or RNA helicase
MEAKKKENPRANLDEERRQIADVYKKSEGKLPELKKLLGDTSILDRCIIFGPEKEFNSMTKGMLTKTKVRWTPYYGETSQKQLDLYRNNSVDVLLTCKAVSEGMDLHVNNIILLSSDRTNLVTLQRLGRALRTHGDVTKVARVYDFIRISDNETTDSRRKDWLEGLSQEGLAARNGM